MNQNRKLPVDGEQLRIIKIKDGKEIEMKTIGLIGGMSWESTVSYYQIINETIKKKLGGLHSAKILLYSVDFSEIEECQAKGEWDRSAVILAKAAENLEKAGADFIVICTNTMHKVAPQIQEHIHILVFSLFIMILKQQAVIGMETLIRIYWKSITAARDGKAASC